MRNSLKFLFACVVVFGLQQPASSEDVQIPAPQGLVSDFAGVIDQPTRQQLTLLLQELKDKTGAEIAIVTVETPQPLTVFDYAMKIAEAWKPGAKGKDNGVVFLIATKDHKMFIVTGYGVEGVLPDGKVGEIQDEYIVPYFKRGDYARGILAGAQVMADLIAKEYGVRLTGVSLSAVSCSPWERGSVSFDALGLCRRCARPDRCGLYGYTAFALYPLWRPTVWWGWVWWGRIWRWGLRWGRIWRRRWLRRLRWGRIWWGRRGERLVEQRRKA